MNKDPKYTMFSRTAGLLSFLLLLSACANVDKEITEIMRMEADFRALIEQKGMSDEVRPEAAEIVIELTAFAERWPDHPNSPEYLHNAAAVAADFLTDYSKAADLFKKVADRYPDHELAERCRFLEAFTLAEFVKDADAAKQAYAVFLSKFPSSELAESAQFEMENL